MLRACKWELAAARSPDRRDDHRKAADGDQAGVRAGGGEVIEAPWRVNSGIEALNPTEEPGQRADVAVA